MPSQTKDKQHLLWNMVTEFMNEFKGMLQGKQDKSQQKSKEMRGGAKIKEFFEKVYVEYARNYQATSDYTDADIERAIALHEGDQLPGFPSVDVFHYLMRSKLELLIDPASDCLSDVHLYIEEMASEICDKVFMRFPSARNAIMEIVSKTLFDQMERTKKVTDSIVKSELGYQFTNDAHYLQNRTEIVPEQDAKPGPPGQQHPHGQPGQPQHQQNLPPAASKQNRRKIYVDEIRKRIDEYFKLVVRSIRDGIPKAIGFFLVQGIQDKLQFELYAAVNKDDDMAKELGEPPEITVERKTLKESIATMKKSLKVLQRDPEITATLSYDDELSRDIKESLGNDKKKQKMQQQQRQQPPPGQGGRPMGAPPGGQQRQGPPPGQGGRPMGAPGGQPRGAPPGGNLFPSGSQPQRGAPQGRPVQNPLGR